MTIHAGGDGSEPSRRDRLVLAAAQAFAAVGFQRATVPQIAEAAGVSTGLLYRHFAGKAALAQAIVEQDRERTRGAIEELVAGVPDARAALRLLIEEGTAMAAADPDACALVAEIAAESRRDPVIRSTVIAADDATTTLVADLIRRAGTPLDPQAGAVLVLSALDGFAIRVAVEPGWDPRPAASALVTALGLDRTADVR